ncbi:hypothetical protein ACPV3A_08170 [Paenibacillus sp. Dod16]|uniref:hypothetical protein n=1 Tax=Paenibacillus sp. Dod16 TaxID=3416392 RepID=UPI003CEE1CEC
MQTAQVTMVSIPFPTKWGIRADIAGRPIVWGELIINSITDNRVIGTINFRGMPIPIHGSWNESAKQITFDSPYATYSGNLTIFDDPPIRIRHFILSGRLIMKPPSLQAGEYGTWIATTDISLNAYPISGNSLPYQYTDQLPPVGVFLTSNILYQLQEQHLGRFRG